jgi:NAD/NADP transhydrogenase alpha subunit
MTTTQIIMIIAALAVIAALVARRGGPRVTRIDREAEREKEIEDRDDA